MRAAVLAVWLPTWALGQSGGTPARLSPQDWAVRILETCQSEEAHRQERWAALKARLEASAQSQAELDFAAAEPRARQKSLAQQRRSYFMRLESLFLGAKAQSLGPAARRFRRAIGVPPVEGRNAFRRSLDLLLRDATPCGLDGLETTLFLAIFDFPFTPEPLAAGLGIAHVHPQLQRAYRERVESLGTLEGVYRHLRPPDPEVAFGYVDGFLARLSQAGSSDSSARADAERSRLLEQLSSYLRLVAEPLRIQTYLRTKVEELEGALRTTIPDEASEKLFRRAEKALYPDERALRELAGTPPEQILAKLQQALDRWFRQEALPAVRRHLYRDPFSAYWFFVQTGALARPGRVSKASRLRMPRDVFTLASLKGLSLEDALARWQQERLPGEFLESHAALERIFTEFTLSRDAALLLLNTLALRPRDKEKLRRYLTGRDAAEEISALDIYAHSVRDANQIGGAADWNFVHAGLRLLHHAKAEQLDQQIALILDSARLNRAQLRRYLNTLSQLLLELEFRQARNRRFQEATGGGLSRWVLRDLLMSPGTPVQLWAPSGVTGKEFAEFLDELTPKNKKSGNRYQGKLTRDIRLIPDGRKYHEALVEVINTGDSFLNLAVFDWKLDPGGKEIAYRIMAKKLGIEGLDFDRFLATFPQGLPLVPGAAPTRFYDLPPDRMKNLLVYFFFTDTRRPPVAEVHRQLEEQLGSPLTCPSVLTCGDLSPLRARAGRRYQPRRTAEPGYQELWQAFRNLQALFDEREVDLRRTRPRHSLAEYIRDADRLRAFVRRYGRKRADDPAQPFPINFVLDGKQDLFNLQFHRPNERFPFFFSDPFWNLYLPLYEFDVRLVLWKGVIEFPWHLGPLPLPGRKIFGFLPMPYVPFPWLRLVPGFRWLGIFESFFLQHLVATDPRALWAIVMHVKSISNESAALESGMGLASKYFNAYEDFKTWHDMGVRVEGPIVGDVNDHFVQLFNLARVNNTGVPHARGVKIPRLRYADYRYQGPPGSGPLAWVLTTDPDRADYNYRGIFMAALAAARKNIYIENSFFSDPLVSRLLIRKAREFRARVNCAGLEGFACAEKKREAVTIHVVLPDVTDKPMVDVVVRAHLNELLHLGVKVYRWNPARGWSASKMLHTKAWLIDYEEGQPALTYVGSANATQRSHLTDNELGIVSTSAEFARQVHDEVFRPDMTTDSRLETLGGFHLAWSTRRLTRTGRWVQNLLVNLFWLF